MLTEKVVKCPVCHGESEDCENCFGEGYYTEKVQEDERVFVNVYLITRHWGGSEEGGWYWNNYNCVEVVPCKNKYADEIKAQLEKDYEGRKHGNIYSVLGGQDVEVLIEQNMKASETRERPHYE